MPAWIAPVIILAMVVVIYGLSEFRKIRVQKFSDSFCIAFIEICDHIMQERDYAPGVKYENTGKDTARMLPFDQQPELIQELLSTKPDEYVLERFRKMHELRENGQKLLSSYSLIASRYNGAFNRLFTLTEVLLATMHDINSLNTKDRLLDLNFILLKQNALRSETIPAIMSKKSRKA